MLKMLQADSDTDLHMMQRCLVLAESSAEIYRSSSLRNSTSGRVFNTSFAVSQARRA